MLDFKQMKIPQTFLLVLAILAGLTAPTLTTFAEENTASGPLLGTPLQFFHLNDGSTIKGKLSGVQGDHYLVESTSMGNISIRADNVLRIDSAPTSAMNTLPSGGNFSQGMEQAGAGENGPMPLISSPQAREGVAQLQQKMMSDPSLMNDVKNLAQDPSFLAIMNDPELMKAIMSMDVEKIRLNPKAMELMNNPKMQELMQKTGQMPKTSQPSPSGISNL